jgi:tRNA modification GTPase
VRELGGTGTPVVVVETKADLGGVREPGEEEDARVAAKLRVSALTGEGLDQLRQTLPELVYSAVVSVSREVPVLTRRRHAAGLEKARSEVAAFGRALEEGLPPEVATAHLRPAETALEEILGVISVEDVLDAVFAEFCVGK